MCRLSVAASVIYRSQRLVEREREMNDLQERFKIVKGFQKLLLSGET